MFKHIDTKSLSSAGTIFIDFSTTLPLSLAFKESKVKFVLAKDREGCAKQATTRDI